MLVARDPAQLSQCAGRHTTTGDPLGKAIADLGLPVHEVVQVEASYDRFVLIDEHVKNADTGLLLSQKRAMAVRELRKEIVSTIADRLGEVRPVGQFESEDRRLVIAAKALQFEHLSNLVW